MGITGEIAVIPQHKILVRPQLIRRRGVSARADGVRLLQRLPIDEYLPPADLYLLPRQADDTLNEVPSWVARVVEDYHVSPGRLS